MEKEKKMKNAQMELHAIEEDPKLVKQIIEFIQKMIVPSTKRDVNQLNRELTSNDDNFFKNFEEETLDEIIKKKVAEPKKSGNTFAKNFVTFLERERIIYEKIIASFNALNSNVTIRKRLLSYQKIVKQLIMFQRLLNTPAIHKDFVTRIIRESEKKILELQLQGEKNYSVSDLYMNKTQTAFVCFRSKNNLEMGLVSREKLSTKVKKSKSKKRVEAMVSKIVWKKKVAAKFTPDYFDLSEKSPMGLGFGPTGNIGDWKVGADGRIYTIVKKPNPNKKEGMFYQWHLQPPTSIKDTATPLDKTFLIGYEAVKLPEGKLSWKKGKRMDAIGEAFDIVKGGTYRNSDNYRQQYIRKLKNGQNFHRNLSPIKTHVEIKKSVTKRRKDNTNYKIVKMNVEAATIEGKYEHRNRRQVKGVKKTAETKTKVKDEPKVAKPKTAPKKKKVETKVKAERKENRIHKATKSAREAIAKTSANSLLKNPSKTPWKYTDANLKKYAQLKINENPIITPEGLLREVRDAFEANNKTGASGLGKQKTWKAVFKNFPKTLKIFDAQRNKIISDALKNANKKVETYPEVSQVEEEDVEFDSEEDLKTK